MKRILLVALLAVTALGTATAQRSQYEVSNPNPVVIGTYSVPVAYGAGVNFPMYTKVDSPTANTGIDSQSFKLIGEYNSVYTWVHVHPISGTLNAVTVTLLASPDSGAGKDFFPVFTTTLTGTRDTAVGYLFPIKWPYTNAKWSYKGGGTEYSSWYSGLMVRYVDAVSDIDAVPGELCDLRKRPWKKKY